MFGMKIFGFVTAIAFLGNVRCLEFKNGAYEELVIQIADTVPEDQCTTVLENLKTTLTSASQYLFSALDSRAFLRSATVLLPPSWHDSCAPSAVLSASGETSDITVTLPTPMRGKIYTQQSLGCGQPGDQMYLNYEGLLQKDSTLARSLIKEFAKYRYGVFEETGYYNDPIHPMCYYDDQQQKAKVTGCSDLPINDNGICSDSTAPYNISKMVDSKARSSIMFAVEAPSVSMFCDDGIHNRLSPTKHNLMCQRRSVLDVILNHSDFKSKNVQGNMQSNVITDTTPKVVFKRQSLTRYMFVIENTKDMMLRESWSYLRLAVRQWALSAPRANIEVGLVLTNFTTPIRALNILSMKDSLEDTLAGRRNGDKFYSAIPYVPSESLHPGCLHCAVKEAMDMLNDKTKTDGAANNVIVVIAPGMTVDENINSILTDLKRNRIKVATINYPNIIRTNTLREFADATGGMDYTVFEQKLNVETTLLSTYFELQNVMKDIIRRFYSGNIAELPVEIHRKEIKDDGRQSVSGSFMLDTNMGEPAQFAIYTHNIITPLITGVKLISPTHQVFETTNDRLIHCKMITLDATISEPGTWTYNIEHYSGSPQPHFLQVLASPKSSKLPIVQTTFRTHRNNIGEPLILLATVKYGETPIIGAKVEVTITKMVANGSTPYVTKFELLDSGSGDPDITKGDGIYTRYYSASEWGPGLYTFEAIVSDNGNTAYTLSATAENTENKPCCGSAIVSKGSQPISPFQRVLPKVSLMISSEEIESASEASVGRIGDLKVEIIPEDMKARLSWSSPDMGGLEVNKYETRYGYSISDIIDQFETKSIQWEDVLPFPLTPGSETSLTLDFSQNKGLLDKPLYFAIKAYSRVMPDFSGPISNWVRVLVPSPPPPPTVAPTYFSNEQSFWPNNFNSVGIDPVGQSIAKSMSIGLELILPIVIGIMLLVVLIIVYCYFCVLRKRTHIDPKSAKANAIKKDNLSSNITIVPSSPQNSSHAVTPTYPASEIPDPHQVGVPISNYGYEDETKQRYSLVHQQEQQLIEELKQQQQQMHQHPPTYSGVSVISNNTITRNGHTLSPYNSWSASQLLHEHERRHSPMDNMMTDEQILAHQEVLMNSVPMEHSIDHMSINGHQIPEQYIQGHLPPPVPPLPALSNGYTANYSIYGVHQGPNQIYQSMPRNEPFNASLQGSLSSVNSGEKKRRNVTMV